jgi:hypothetical protein
MGRSGLPERLSPGQASKQEHSLFSVMDEKLGGRITALIIAATEADAEYYALHELGLKSRSFSATRKHNFKLIRYVGITDDGNRFRL